jgi:carboxyl-terminal processing protease
MALLPGLASVHAVPHHADPPEGRQDHDAGSTAGPEVAGQLFENVVAVLRERYFDVEFRENVLPGLAERYRARARATVTLAEQRQVTHEFLSNIPSSHTCLLSAASHARMGADLNGDRSPTLGFDLTELDGKHYSTGVLEGGSAERAGLLRGDRIVSIDGVDVAESSRLDWRTDDAYLPDPPHRFCLCQEGEVVQLKLERRPGVYLDLDVECQLYSSFEASTASARIIERGGKRIGYLHLWLVYLTGVDTLLKDKLEGSFADCDALVVDLRGRGGSGFMVPRLLDILDGTSSSWTGPVVGLTDRGSRSAKDVIAYEFRNRKIGRLVGETTAGAVIPATLEDVGHETHLMFPAFKMTDHTDRLEFSGVPPDVVVEQVLP